MRPLLPGLMRRSHRSPGGHKPAFDTIELRIGGLSAASLAQRFGTPLLAVGSDHIEGAALQLLSALAAAGPTGSRLLLPYGDLPLAPLLAPVHGAGIGAAVTTLAQLELAARLDPRPGQLVLDGCVRSEALLRRAIEQQPFAVIVDELIELQLLRALARETQVQVAVGLSLSTAADNPCGLEIEGGEAERACQYLFEHNQAFTLVSLHCGLDPGSAARRGLRAVLDFLRLLRQRYRVDVPYLDLGYMPEFPEGLAALTSEVAEFCRIHGLVQPKWILRPGAQLGSGAGTLLTRVESVRHRRGGQRFVLTDADIASDSGNAQPAAARPPADQLQLYHLASRDGTVSAEAVALAPLHIGELLALPGHSLHAMSAPPSVVLVTQGAATIVSAAGERDDMGTSP